MLHVSRISAVLNDSMKEYLAVISEGERLSFLEDIIGPEVNGPINKRAAIVARLNACRLPNGKVWVQHSSRDCDGVYGYHSYQIEGTLQAFNKEYQEAENWAEGPFSLDIIPEKGRNETIGLGWGIV